MTIEGTLTGTLAEARELLDLARARNIAPIPTRNRPLGEVQAALDDLRAGRIVGRTVLKASTSPACNSCPLGNASNGNGRLRRGLAGGEAFHPPPREPHAEQDDEDRSNQSSTAGDGHDRTGRPTGAEQCSGDERTDDLAKTSHGHPPSGAGWIRIGVG